MKKSINSIRNKIRKHSKDSLLSFCYVQLEKNKNNQNAPIWDIFILMKWTYLFSGEVYPTKELTIEKFNRILIDVGNFNNDYIGSYFKNKKIDRAFFILSNQQFYLQEKIYREKFLSQLVLFTDLKSKYDINHSFKTLTGINIKEFITLMHIFWLYFNTDIVPTTNLNFKGYIEDIFLLSIKEKFGLETVEKFIQLLTLDSKNPVKDIKNFKSGIKKNELQSLERTFFTLHPFQIFDNKVKLISKKVFNYSITYFIYDYMKTNDDKFTTEFGLRFEKYIEFGLKEMNVNYLKEAGIKKLLKEKSKVIDFWDKSNNILMECKGIELKPYPSVSPTDEIIFNSLKDSIMKAYFEQLLPVSNVLNKGSQNNFALILTYKRIFWNQFDEFFEIGKQKYSFDENEITLPPENVFLLDIYTWEKIINIIKNSDYKLIDILKKIKKDNLNKTKRKQFVDMHLENFPVNKMNLSYLKSKENFLKV